MSLTNRCLTVIGCVLVAFTILLRVIGVFTYLPVSFVDEVIYIEPAINMAQGDKPLATGMDLQLTNKGIIGLNKVYHLTTPINWAIRIPFLCLVGNVIIGKGISEMAILVIFTLAFVFALKARINWPIAVFSLGVLLFYRYTGFASAGRPDLLCAAFGLLSFGLILRADKARWFFLFAAGMCSGLSFITHQFGGIVWGGVSTALLCWNLWPKGYRDFIRCLLLFIGGGAAIGATYIIYVFQNDFEAWRSQFFWLVELKKHLNFNPRLASVEVLKNILMRNPLPWFLLLLVFSTCRHIKNMPIVAIALAFMAIGIAWRVNGFEHYNTAYNVHFWTLLCLAIAFGLPELINSVEYEKHLRFIAIATLASFIIVGILGNINIICSTFFLNHADAFHKRQEILSGIPDNANVLVSSSLYFEVLPKNKVLMAHHEKMDLDDFDFIILSTPTPLIKYGQDQWVDVLTAVQNESFNHGYSLFSYETEKKLGWTVPLTPVQPSTLGCYIFKRNK